MQQALDSAGLAPSDIDYINLHGTATKSNVRAKNKAVFEVFGGRTPCSSTKGATGHLLGAAGITEAMSAFSRSSTAFQPGARIRRASTLR